MACFHRLGTCPSRIERLMRVVTGKVISLAAMLRNWAGSSSADGEEGLSLERRERTVLRETGCMEKWELGGE